MCWKHELTRRCKLISIVSPSTTFIAALDLNLGPHRDAPEPALLTLDCPLSDADKAHQVRPIDRLVGEETGSRPWKPSERAPGL